MDSLGKAKVAAASTAVRESERAAMTPSLHRVASPSPIKVKKREAQKPRLDVTAASVGALRLPTELFQLATSRTLAASHGQADLVLSKALDGIQAAVGAACGRMSLGRCVETMRHAVLCSGQGSIPVACRQLAWRRSAHGWSYRARSYKSGTWRGRKSWVCSRWAGFRTV